MSSLNIDCSKNTQFEENEYSEIKIINENQIEEIYINNLNSETKIETIKPLPLVLVEGFLAVNNKWYWGSLEYGFKNSKLPQRQIIYPEIGSISSLHDRACEIFYQIKGGTVDYGESHSKIYRHKRYGKTYKGLYSKWNQKNPIHIAGYSYGGNTIWKLQQMLDQKMFEGYDTNADWIYSLTGFVSPFMGTPLLEPFGATPSELIKGTPLDFLCYGIVCYDKLKLYNIKNNKIVFKQNCIGEYSEEFKRSTNQLDLLKQIEPHFRVRQDNAAVDMMPHRMQAFNVHSKTFRNTYYRSYSAKILSDDGDVMNLLKRFHFMFVLSALYLYFYKPDKMNKKGPLVQILESKKSVWRFNDGICPTNFLYHPGECNPNFCAHQKSFDDKIVLKSNNEKGIWKVVEVDNCTHRGMFPYGSVSNRNPKKTLVKKQIHAKTLNNFIEYLIELDCKYYDNINKQ